MGTAFAYLKAGPRLVCLVEWRERRAQAGLRCLHVSRGWAILREKFESPGFGCVHPGRKWGERWIDDGSLDGILTQTN